MALSRREKLRAATYAEIKDTARRLMQQQGTAGLGLRAIAREMEMTAPAIYRYFSSLDDLITTLIVENFNALADAMAAGANSQHDQDFAGRLRAGLLAYRDWAITHPVDFQLIYGNPIPGYEAPAEITVPAAQRGFEIIVSILDAAWAAGQLKPAADYQPPMEVDTHLRELAVQYSVSASILYLTTVGWGRIHGILMLELFNHLQPVVGDVEAFYRAEIDHLLRDIGFSS